MGKIGDLFVRLGLKSDNLKAGLEKAKDQVKSFGSKLGNMKAGAVAAWAAIAAAAAAFAKNFASHTNAMNDAWEKGVSKLKATWHSFVADLSTNKWGTNTEGQGSKVGNAIKNEIAWWKRLIGHAKEASQAAGEATEAFDKKFELEQSVKLQRLAVQQELNELYVAMRDVTLSGADRVAAADKYKAILKPIADAEVAVYGEMLEAAITQWQAGNDLDRVYSVDEMTEFFTKIGTEYDKMAKKFPELMRVYETRKGDAQNQPIFDLIATYQQAANQMSNVEREMSRTTNSIKASIQRSLEGIAAEVAKYGQEDLKLDLDIELDVDEIDWSALEEEFANNLSNLQNTLGAQYAEIDNLNQMLASSLTSAFSNGLQGLTDFIMGVEGASVEEAMAAFVRPIADMMKGMGEMFMAEGLAELMLVNGTPAQKIAAGAALVAISAAISSGLAKMSGAVGSGTVAGGTAASSTPERVETLEQDITVHVVGTISGSDIVLAGDKTLNKWRR